MEEGGQLGRKNYPFSHGAFYFNDKKDINMERLWPISGILKFDLNPQSTILCSQMLEVIFVYAPIVFKSCRIFQNSISMNNAQKLYSQIFTKLYVEIYSF